MFKYVIDVAGTYEEIVQFGLMAHEKYGLNTRVLDWSGPAGGAAEMELSHEDQAKIELFIREEYTDQEEPSLYMVA